MAPAAKSGMAIRSITHEAMTQQLNKLELHINLFGISLHLILSPTLHFIHFVAHTGQSVPSIIFTSSAFLEWKYTYEPKGVQIWTVCLHLPSVSPPKHMQQQCCFVK